MLLDAILIAVYIFLGWHAWRGIRRALGRKASRDADEDDEHDTCPHCGAKMPSDGPSPDS